MKACATLIAAVFVFLSAEAASPAQSERLLGAWTLVSVSAAAADGQTVTAPFGAKPTGMLIYSSDGRMSAMISYDGRKPLSRTDRLAASPEERAEAFSTFLAYAGRYSLAGNQVTHHVEVASIQNWVNTDLVRFVSFDGERLVLRTAPTSVGGTMRTTALVWQRAATPAH